METENQDEKKCENCKYFYQHYFKLNSRLRKTSCGHCVNTRIIKKTKKPFEICDRWEHKEITITEDERKQSVKETLTSMSKSLKDIALIFKDET